MAALAAAYGTGDRGWGLRPAADEMVIMLPALRSFIPGRTLLIVKNVAVRLASIEARQPDPLISSNGPGGTGLPPTLATRMSMGASSSSIRRRIASTSAKRVTSAVT